MSEVPPPETLIPEQHPTARLVCLVGSAAGHTFAIGLRPKVIGRGPDADIRLEGPEISRAHARISWREGQFVVEDLGSRNGTQVNGVPIEKHALRIGDRIQIGGGAILVYAHHDDLERRVHRLQKLEGLAQLATGMVHDFKNSLAVILANGEHVEQWLAEHGADEDVAHAMRDVLIAARDADALTRRLLFFARREAPPQLDEVEVEALVDEAVSFVRRSFETQHKISFEIRLAPRLRARGNRAELHHALLNLLFNARDAMPGGGRIHIEAHLLHVVRADALLLHLPSDGPFVELALSDTGVGMDEATLSRAFEPFFTTKGAREGTGLGLATVYGVIRDHGGNVLVDSAVGKGTRFRLLIPAVARGASSG